MHRRPILPPHPADRPGWRLADGALRVLLADALVLPTGLVIVAYLTRRIGPSAYGLYVVAATLTAWIEWTLATIFSRPTIKIVSDAAAWEPVAATVLRVQLAVSITAAVLLWILAGTIASALNVPALARTLRLFAIDIPLFTLAAAHWQVAVGLGRFRPRAAGSAARWVSRLVFVVLFVELGGSADGAVAAVICASVVELFVARRYVRPRLLGRVDSVTRLLPVVAPLVMYAVSMRLLDKVDLLMLKALGASMAAAGVYGAAQSLCLLPGLVAQSLAPLTLATVNRLLKDGREQEGRDVARQALRSVLWMVPFAAAIAGSAGEVVALVLGDGYRDAAVALAWLMPAAVAQAAIAVGSMILAARGRAGLIWAIGGSLCPVAIVAHLLVIPRWGSPGAAAVTMMTSAAGAIAMWVALARTWDLRPSGSSLLRATVASVLACGLAVSWAVDPLLLPVKLAAIGAAVTGAQVAMGELTARDRALLWSLAGRRHAADGPFRGGV